MGNSRSIPIVKKQGLYDRSDINGTFAISSMEGFRNTMEDTHIYHNMKYYAILGIFDGHGNDTCAQFCQNNFLKLFEMELAKTTATQATPEEFKHVLVETFKKLDNEFELLIKSTSKECNSGTTALVSVITETHYIIANAGDSRGLVIDKTEKSIKFATTDHKPTNENEKKRIDKTRHYVMMNRIDKTLGVSRGIGDFQYKDGNLLQEQFAVTCIPDVEIISKNFNTLLILACDGIWDVLSNESVMEYLLKLKKYNFTKLTEFDDGTVCTIDKYYEALEKTSLSSEYESNPIQKICENLINIAFDHGSQDNFTVAIYNC